MECVRSAFNLSLESADFALFYDQQMQSSAGKDTFYSLQSALSVLLQLPTMLANCPQVPKQQATGEIAQYFNDDILSLMKSAIYAETTMSMVLQEEWALSGYYALYSLMTLISFLSNYSSA